MPMTDDELLNLPETDFEFSDELKYKLGIINELEQNKAEEKAEHPAGEISRGALPVKEKSIGKAAKTAIPSMDYSEAHRLLKQALKLQITINELLNDTPDDARLIDAAVDYRNGELSRLLVHTSVDELKSYKPGIRVSALHDAGIFNIEQLRGCSYSSLMTIPGIGAVSAGNIVDAVKTAVISVRSNLDTLPYQADTVHGRKFVLEAYKLLANRNLYRKIVVPLKEQKKELYRLCSRAACAENRLTWLLTFSNQNKLEALNAAADLKRLLNNGLKESVEACVSKKAEFNKVKENAVWNYYIKEPEKLTDVINCYLYSNSKHDFKKEIAEEYRYTAIDAEEVQDMKETMKYKRISVALGVVVLLLFCTVFIKNGKLKDTQYIGLSEAFLTLCPGDTAEITATVYPSTAGNSEYELVSSDLKVAAVQNGTITATGPGEADIEAFQDGIAYGKCHIEVRHIEPEEMDFGSDISGKIGRTEELKIRFSPVNTTDTGVSFSVSDESVATVTGNKISFLKKGTVTVTAVHETTGLTAEKKIEATPVELETFSINLPESMAVGQTIDLEAVFTPEDTTDQAIKWSSSNNAKAVIEDGKLIAKKAGTVTITAVHKATRTTESIEIEIIEQ